MRTIIGRRQFTLDDQLGFAALTGDANPMHVDPVAARRTPAGAPAVHGVHLLAWLLDRLAAEYPNLPPVRSIDAKFARFVVIGQDVSAALIRLDSAGLRADVSDDTAPCVHLKIRFGEPASTSPVAATDSVATPIPPHALDPSAEEMARNRGRLPFANTPDQYARTFPDAARWIGPDRLAALGGCTCLVGMINPGMHSIFSSLTLAVTQDDPTDGIEFAARHFDERFGMVTLNVYGGRIQGTLSAVRRPEPVVQPTMDDIGKVVAPTRFAETSALIVGGSRGLGELTAKLIAAGGGRVVITYATGKSDAERVMADIIASGGRCSIMPYNAEGDPQPQLAQLPVTPGCAFYFATPSISASASLYSSTRLDAFRKVYIDGFVNLVSELAKDRVTPLSVYYPSTTFIEEQPAGMAEYAMTKAMGEILCAYMTSQMANVVVDATRLPRLPTDQTNSLITARLSDPFATLLPIICRVVDRGAPDLR